MGRSGSIDHRAFRRLITGTDSVDKSFSLRPSFFFIRISHRGDAVFSSFLREKKKKKQGNQGSPNQHFIITIFQIYKILKRIRGSVK